MNRLGDAPTDLLFGLIALQNDMVQPEVIPAALRAQYLQPEQTLGELLVTQGLLTSRQRDLVETLSGEYIDRHAGDAAKSVATLIATPSARVRLDQLGDVELTESIRPRSLLESTVPAEPDLRGDDPDRTLLPAADDAVMSRLQIAGYEILHVLGAGGMGIVYKARQPRLDRFVALKMIRAGAGARPEDFVRFEAEAKAVAAIDHSNIVKIFEIGEHDGLPYFSLEYLAGGTLAARIGGKPQPVDDAARIVETLARAMHVAHEHKVIHRDLKPANVLFAADGALKITDFGLVKRLETDSGQTRSGSILGTPSYMAPEQARGESQNVGPAADQYALGAILYELLTGRPPFQGRSVLDTLDMVRSREPLPPSQLQPKTPRDVETICLKCLEKDIARRYSDALAVAEDLRRFRAGETILARPVSDIERLWRWCLRNRRVALLSTAVALLLVTVAGGSAIAAMIVGRQNTALAQANTRAEDKRQDAERKEQLAIAAARAANEQNRHAVEADVDQIILLERDLRHVPVLQNKRDQIIDKAIGRLQAAARAMTNLRRDINWAPEDEAHNWRSLARAHQAQARVSISRNKIHDAMDEFRQAEEIITRLADADPNDLDIQVNLLRTRRQMGYVSMYNLGNSDDAIRLFRSAIDISRECLAKKRDSDVYKSELANSLGNLAGLEEKLGHLEQARDLYREENVVRKSFSPAQARDWESRREAASHLAQLAGLTILLGDLNEGKKLYDECADRRQQIADERPDSWLAQNDLGLSHNSQGAVRFPQGPDPQGARGFHRKALAIFAKRAKTDPLDLENKNTLALTHYYEATCAIHSGDKNGAAAGYRRSLETFKEIAAHDPNVKMPRTGLMLALARCGDHVQAAQIALSLVATPPKNEYLYVQSACGYALAADAAGKDAQLKKRYTDAAIDCLRKAKERGWADVVTLETETDLEPIHNEPAFQALLADLRRISVNHR
jgi:eukaryotic-like serine/threonine-protein kinase